MRISSFALYVFVGMVGIVATGVFADKHPLNADRIYAVGIVITLLLFPVVFLLRRKWDRARYGTKVRINLKKYKVPAVCPETGLEASELRFCQFALTGGVVSLQGTFPVLLAPEPAAAFDKRFLKTVPGLRIIGASGTEAILYVKDKGYLCAIREANRDTGAVKI
jgi:hypothetical protein